LNNQYKIVPDIGEVPGIVDLEESWAPEIAEYPEYLKISIREGEGTHALSLFSVQDLKPSS